MTRQVHIFVQVFFIHFVLGRLLQSNALYRYGNISNSCLKMIVALVRTLQEKPAKLLCSRLRLRAC